MVATVVYIIGNSVHCTCLIAAVIFVESRGDLMDHVARLCVCAYYKDVEQGLVLLYLVAPILNWSAATGLQQQALYNI